MPVFDLDVPRVEEAAIRIDGAADEASWQQAVQLPDFVTFRPTPDGAPHGQTAVRMIADDRGLWFHFRADDPEPDKVRAGLGRRDTRLVDDFVGVYIDPAGTVQRSYAFACNVLGVQTDGTNAAGAPEDPSWDARWFCAGRRTDAGYEVEIGIPWRAIRHPRDSQKIGLWAYRSVPRIGEKSSWPRLDPNVAGLLIQEAIVGGPGELPRTLGLEVQPELTWGRTDRGEPVGRYEVGGFGPGLTVRYGPSAAFQGLGTVNPDFSQVESDASQVDLNRRYALYYEERRPFFLEGQETFTHPFDDLVFTRSMSVPAYGVRATSELGGWTVAGLHVLDRDPLPTVSEGGGWDASDLRGHDALDTVLRVRSSIGPDSFAGVLLSDKEIAGTELSNRLGGMDTRVRVSDRMAVEAAALASSTVAAGVGSAVAPAGVLSANYGSEVVSGWTDLRYIAPDFRAENGFVTGADRASANGGVGFDVYPKWKVLPTVGFWPAQGGATVDTAGALRFAHYAPEVYGQLGNGVEWSSGYTHAAEVFAGETLVTDRASADLDGSWTEWFRADVGGATGTGILYDEADPGVGLQHQAWSEIALQPLPGLTGTFSATYERFLQDGVDVYAGWVGRGKLELFASRQAWTRFIVDRSTFDRRTSVEALAAYEVSPGSAFYAGGSHQSTFGDAPTWSLFAKASWVLRQ
jgi:hypothetical protein